MTTVQIRQSIGKKALLSRSTARLTGERISQSLSQDSDHSEGLVLDFLGIDAVSPSFVDELLLVIGEHLRQGLQSNRTVLFTNVPTRLSEKFAAVGRGHSLIISERESGTWALAS